MTCLKANTGVSIAHVDKSIIFTVEKVCKIRALADGEIENDNSRMFPIFLLKSAPSLAQYYGI
jgi:hypothetical protein